MSRLRLLIARAAGLLATRRRDRELEAELDAHLEMEIEELVRSGVPRADARHSLRT